MSISPTTEKKSWFDFSGDGAGLNSRIQKINKYRSPHTKADEILRILQWFVQPLLILYCMVLSFASYQAFFEHNFSAGIATLGAVLLCIVIEFGKIKIGAYVFQKPFLEGLEGFKGSFAEFSVWFGALLFAGVAFTMSVINSTTGAHALSVMKGTAKNETAFAGNTADLDRQISETNARIKQNGTIKWKGVVTYQAQKAIERDTRTLEALNRQKESATNTQRADFERTRSINDTNTQTGANILMASGGWVEGLQMICLFLIAACMSVVGSVMDREQKNSHTATNNPNTNSYRSGAANSSPANNSGAGQTIGFFWDGYGQQAAQQSFAVPQQPFTVPQQTVDFSTIGCDAVLENCRQAVQRDLPNLLRPDAKPATVSERINKALDDAFDIVSKDGFSPSHETGLKFYKFLAETALPTLNDRGWPYSRDTFFMKQILAVIPKQNA